MTQASLLDAVEPATKYDAVRDYFRQRPNQWISALELQQVGGWLSWRTRVSEVRRWCGMRIENRPRVINGQRRSEYRWVP